mmetsp:Transcript_19768/g.47759  ORF Transcript_19768/g.47759 Transcript_19768/m.47759 type:complete len:670 (+) Transcript_19768:262-2271(+)
MQSSHTATGLSSIATATATAATATAPPSVAATRPGQQITNRSNTEGRAMIESSHHEVVTTDMKNVLSFRIPGVDQKFFVKFPGSRLPVCDTCKRLFKTREICRVRQKHTAEPWTPVYICLTLDASCTATTTTTTTDGDGDAQQREGGGRLVDKPFVCRPAQSRTFCAPPSFFSQKDQPPVCTTCKKANRAKKTCRGRYTHGQLPWSTVYVTLSTAESVDPKTIHAPSSQSLTETVPLLYPSSSDGGMVVSDSKPPLPSPSQGQWNGTSMNPRSGGVESPSKDDPTAIVSKVSLESPPSARSERTAAAAADGHNNIMPSPTTHTGDQVYPIPTTRTMLLSVSSQSTTLTWVEPRQNSHSTKGPSLKSSGRGLPASTATGTGHHAAINMNNTFQSPPSYQPFPLVATADAGTLPFGDVFMGNDQYGAALQHPDYTVQQQQQHPYPFAAYEEDIHRYGQQVPLPHLQNTMPQSIANRNASVTAGEAAAAATQQRISGTDGGEIYQTGPAFPDHSRPIAILPQPQNPPGTHLGYFAPPPGMNFPGALNFQNQTMPPHVQMHPYTTHNAGFHMVAPDAPGVDYHGGEGTYQHSFNMAQYPGYMQSAGVMDNSIPRNNNNNVAYGTCNIAPSPSVPRAADQTSGTIPESDEKKKSVQQTESSLGDDRMQKRHRAV